MHRFLPLYFLFFGFIAIGQLPKSSGQKDSVAVSKANFYLKKLRTEYKNGDYQSHKLYSDSLYRLSKEKGLPKFQILGMVNQAVYYNNRAEHDKSIRLYRDALVLADSIPEDYRTKIIVLVNLGNVYTNIDSHKKAIATMHDVLDMLDKYEDNPKIRASAYNGLANNHEGLGEIEKSLGYHFKSKKLGEDIENESIVVTALSNISDAYIKRENYKEAIEHINTALLFEHAQKPTKQRAWLLLNLGIAEHGLGNNTKSIEVFKKTQELAASKGLPKIEMEAYKHMVDSYKENNDFKSMSLANEKFLALQNKILANRQSATKMDFEEDISAKNEIIKSKESVISGLLKNKNRLLLWSGAFASILAIVSLLFFVNHKRFKKEQALLQEQFISLRDSYQNQPEDSYSDYPESTKTRMAVYKNSSLTEEDFTKYKAQLLSYMAEQKPYLNNELSQSNLASQLNISSHHLSEVLNTGFDQNFYNFINSYRVLEAQRLMEKDEFKNSKILAIAFDSGFKSKTSFNRVFKAHTGTTPSEYKKNLTS
ncbi:helix-turn-helix domain-containing protein [Croceitalea marina]|uniref:Helix-turn-helix domain-containing protein n=1 Tax=Croceitalea marina TaxID=1775166 RepID=A0ABW5MTC8_9FLAO